MYRSILVPLDGSPFAEQVLPLALNIARRANARLQIAQVHAPLAPIYMETRPGMENTLAPHLRQRDLAYLSRIEEQLRNLTSVPVTPTLLEGPVSEALYQHALSTSADLVIMCTHGRGPLARAWLGSVAEELVRRLPMPVLLVRPREESFDLKSELDRDAGFQNVLIPLDGSTLAEDILEPAVRLGSLTGARYKLVQVLEQFPLAGYMSAETSTFASDPAFFQGLREFQEEQRGAAQAYLERVAGRLRARSLQVQTQVLVHEQPAVAILEEAQRERADLIAVATHARRGLPRLFLGSVADKILRGASIPVLQHRAAE